MHRDTDAPTRTCCGQVALPGDKWRGRYKPCTHKAKVERDGKWYCGQHDPVAKKEKRDAQLAKWRAENVIMDARLRLERAAPEMLALLVEHQGGVRNEDWWDRRDALLLKVAGDGKSG